MAQKAKSAAYLKNVGKSFGYAVGDVFQSYNPTITNMHRQSKRTIENVKRSMRETKMEQASMSMTEDRSMEYIIEDLMSGKWYNKERSYESESMKDYLINAEDWGDDDTASAVADSAKDIMRQNETKTRDITRAMGSMASDISGAYGIAAAKSASYIVKSNNASAKAIYSMTARGFNQVTSVLMNMNNTLDNIASLGGSLEKHMQNSALFYTNTTETLNKMSDDLSFIADTLEKTSRPATGKYKRGKNGVTSFTDTNGNFDMEAFSNAIISNYKEQKQFFNILLGSAEDGKKGQGTLVQSLLTSAVDSMIPALTKQAMTDFNKMINDNIIAALGQTSVKIKKNTKNPLAMILSAMLPQDNYKNKINTGNYEKGQVAWDGIARKSLVEVIPTYLAKIYAALGGEEKYYDYEKGKFVTLKQIRDNNAYEENVYALNAAGEMRADLRKGISSNNRYSKNKQEIMKKQLDNFFLEAFRNGDDFTEVARHLNGKTKEDREYLRRYRITTDVAKELAKYINSSDVKKNLNASAFRKNLYVNRDKYGNAMRAAEASGTSTLNYEASGFNSDIDKYNKTQAYYLRGIYQMVGNIYVQMGGQGIYDPTKPRPTRTNQYFDVNRGRIVNRKSGSSEKQKLNISTSARHYVTDEDIKYGPVFGKDREVAKTAEQFKKGYEDVFNNVDRVLLGMSIEDYKNAKDPNRAVPKQNRNSIQSILDMPFQAINGVINTLSTSLNQLFWGNDSRPGIIERFNSYLDNFWKKLSGQEETLVESLGLKEAMKQEWANIKSKASQKSSNFFGNVGKKVAAERAGVNYASFAQAARDKSMSLNQRSEAALREANGVGGASGIGIDVGDVYNKNGKWYIHGKKKDVEITQAQADMVMDKKMKRADMSGNIEKAKAVYGKAANYFDTSASLARAEVDANTGALTVIDDGINTLGSGLKEFFSKTIFGDEKQMEKDKKVIFNSVTDVFKEMDNSKGAMAIGGIAGTGVSLLTGAVLGPLAGAAIGAGVGFIAKSEKAQNFLFGEMDENGNYEKAFGNFMMKQLPGIAAGGGIGAAAGMFMGSPLLGAIIGSGVGFVSQSEKAKEFLFGKEDERTVLGLLTDRIKKSAPSMAAGAIAGLIAGPFGIPGNLIIGAGLGLLSTTTEFHKFMFGDPDDPNSKGLTGTLHDKIVNPLDEMMHNLGIRLNTWLKNTGKSLKNKIESFFKDRVKRYKDGEGGFLNTVFGVADKVVRAPINIAGGILNKARNRSRNKNLDKGYNVWNPEEKRLATAEERNAMRADNGLRTSSLDKAIAAAQTTEELKALQNALKDLEDPGRVYKRKHNEAINKLYEVLKANGVPSKDADKIAELVNSANGQSRAIQYLKSSVTLSPVKTASGKLKSPSKQVKDIEDAITVACTAINEAKNDKDITKGTRDLLKDKYGIDASDKGLMNAEEIINNELKVNDKFSDANQQAVKTESFQNNVETYLDKILNTISGNWDLGKEKYTELSADKVKATVGEDGKTYYSLNGKRISKKKAEEIMMNNTDRTITESLYDKKEAVKGAVGAVVDDAKSEISGLIQTTKYLAKTTGDILTIVGGAVGDRIDMGIEGSDQAVADAADIGGTYANSGFFGINRLGHRIANKFRRVGGFVKGATIGPRIDESGSGSGFRRIMRQLSGGEGEGDKKSESTNYGIIQYVKNGQGEWVVDKSDSETKATLMKQAAFDRNIGSIEKISGLLGGLGGAIAGLKTGLLGDGDKKEGLLSKMFKGLFGDEGVFSGLISFFTGKTGGLKGLLKTVISNPTAIWKGVFTNLIGPGLVLMAANGQFDDMASKFTKDALNEESQKDARTYTATTTSGETITYKYKNGKMINAVTGETIDRGSISSVDASGTNRASLSDKIKYNTARGILTNTRSLASFTLGKTAVGKAITNSNVVKDALSTVTHNADDYASLVLQSSLVESLGKVAEKIAPLLAKLGVDPDTTKGMFSKLATTISNKLASQSAKNLANMAANVVVIARIAFAVIDFTTGYEDARTTLGIIDEPTIPQRILSGILRLVKNLIPIVGTLIPDSLIVNVCCDYIAPVFGIDSSELMNQRAKAQETVDSYNAANGTNLSVGDFNKTVLKDYTWTERVGNASARTWEDTKTKFSNGISNIKEKGIGGALKDTAAGMISDFASAYKANGGGVAGIFSGIGESFGNMLPGVIGDIFKANNDIKAFAAKGDIKGLWGVTLSDFSGGEDIEGTDLKTAVPSVFSKMIGQIPLIMTKITTTPVALVSMIGNKIKGGFESIIEGVTKDAPSFNDSVAAMAKAAKDGDVKGVSAVTFTASDDNPVSGLLWAGFGIAKGFQTIAALFNKLFAPVKEIVGGIIDGAKGLVEGAKEKGAEFVDNVKEGASNTWNNLKEGARSFGSNVWNGITGNSGSGSGFVSQYDPRYQGYNVSGQSFAGKGCGPAVASMAASALGKNLSVSDAVSSSRAYQNAGGVSLDYFQQALGSRGISTRYISGGGAGDLYSSIASGDKVVLLGRDASNTSKEYSPFGPNNHYVLATGLDRAGNVIVNDPESNGPRAYNPAILRSVSYGIAGSGSGIRVPFNFRKLSGGGTPRNDATTQQIWAFLTTHLGMSEAAAAGVMGNMEAESGCDPTKNQLKGSAYGLCQWDGGRKTKLLSIANHESLSVQLNYFANELQDKSIVYWNKSGTAYDKTDGTSYSYSAMTYDQFKQMTDVAQATIKFEAAFERAGKIRMKDRINYAKAYYQMFTGKTYIYSDMRADNGNNNGFADASETSTENSGKKLGSSILATFGSIGSIFSNAFNKLFNGSDDEEDTEIKNTGYSSGEDATTGSSVASAKFSSGNDLVSLMRSKLGKLAYSQDPPRDPDKGSADCSSTVRWAVRKASGLDIGGDTGAQYQNGNLSTVWYNKANVASSSSNFNQSNLQPNDILFFRRDKSSKVDKVGHVEVYTGNGMMIGHGGGKNGTTPGPTEKKLDTSSLIKVSRLNTSGSGSLIPMDYTQLARVSGGSSGVLLASRPGSRSAVVAATPTARLNPISFSGGASMVDSTKSMLTSIGNTARSNSNGVNPEVVAKLLESITAILNSIADNTAPVTKIYQALVAYMQSGGSSDVDKVTIPKKDNSTKNTNASNTEIDSNLSTLVGVLAELAKG